jgi:hypothetical protein
MTLTQTELGNCPPQSTRPEEPHGGSKDDRNAGFVEFDYFEVEYDDLCDDVPSRGGEITPTEAAFAVACALAEGVRVRLIAWRVGEKEPIYYEPPLSPKLMALSRQAMSALRELRRRLPPLRER